MDSILGYVKQQIPIMADDTSFDLTLIGLINNELATLSQLGVGPKSGYYINGPENTWDELVESGNLQQFSKTFVYLRVKKTFDPPANSSMMKSIDDGISEATFRIQEAISESESDREW